MANKKKVTTFAHAKQKEALPLKYVLIDSLAQLVEHNTFNVGVMGSNPMRVTYNERVNSFDELTLFFMLCSSYYCKYESFRFECFVFQASI